MTTFLPSFEFGGWKCKLKSADYSRFHWVAKFNKQENHCIKYVFRILDNQKKFRFSNTQAKNQMVVSKSKSGFLICKNKSDLYFGKTNSINNHLRLFIYPYRTTIFSLK